MPCWSGREDSGMKEFTTKSKGPADAPVGAEEKRSHRGALGPAIKKQKGVEGEGASYEAMRARGH